MNESAKARAAADVLAELQANPEYRTEQERRERERRAIEAELSAAERPLVDQLRSAGFGVSSAWDLVAQATPYHAALPILLEYLALPYPDRVREGVARALAVPEAGFAWPTLLDLYRREPAGTDTKDGLAVALGQTATEDAIDDIITLAREPAHGTSRLLLLRRLYETQRPNAWSELERLRRDPELGAEATALLERRAAHQRRA